MHRITRGRALLGVLAIALAGADVATAQVTDPPAELWRDYPLTTRTETPPVVPQAARRRAASSTSPSGPGTAIRRRRSWPRAPGPRGRRGGRGGRLGAPGAAPRAASGAREVVASVAGTAAGPVYEVVWRHGGRRACFELARIDGDDDDAVELPRSRASTWRVEGTPPAVTSLRLDLAELSTHLRASGWQPAGSGDAWYALRFRAPIRSSHPEPVGARRRS